MPKQQEPRAIIYLRTAITELVFWMREWQKRGDVDDKVMVQALWVINLAGATNSGVRYSRRDDVLRLMPLVCKGDIAPEQALETMRRWEHGQAD